MILGRGLKYFLVIIAFCGFLFWALIALVQFPSLGECGMSAGPCYGKKTGLKLNKKDKVVDEYIACPNGKIGFIQAKGTSLPILFKTDANSSIVWAYQFNTDSCCGIPMLKIRGMELQSRNGKHSIQFFNESYSEPGVFILTEDFDFDFLCLSPM